jgi:hypothetical protein
VLIPDVLNENPWIVHQFHVTQFGQIVGELAFDGHERLFRGYHHCQGLINKKKLNPENGLHFLCVFDRWPPLRFDSNLWKADQLKNLSSAQMVVLQVQQQQQQPN